MAVGSFAPVYTHIKETLLSERNRVEYFVLECLAQHADYLGVTFISDRTIGEKVGYATNTVTDAISSLESRGWIKQILLYNPVRRAYTRDIQISPLVIYVREDDFQKANVMFFETDYTQPEPEPNAETRLRPTRTIQTHNHHHHQNSGEPQSPSKNDGGATPPKTKKPKNNDKPARSANETAQSAKPEENTPPGSAEPPQQKLSVYNKPLTSQDAEDMAQIVRARCQTRISQSREICDTYPLGHIKAGLDWVRSEISTGAKIKSPGGLLVWWLRNNALDDDGQPDEPLPLELPAPPSIYSTPTPIEDDEPF